MIKSIKFDPAYDKGLDTNGVVLRFILIGNYGVVHFIIFTNWNLDHVSRKNGKVPFPNPIEVGYFSLYTAMYKGQPKNNVCKYLNHAKCYYDSDSSEGEEAFDLLKTQGDAAVWTFLEIKYKKKFGELK